MPQGNYQFTKFDFYKIDPQWRLLSSKDRDSGKEQFAAVVEKFAPTVATHSYSLVGIRGDCDLLLWKVSDKLDNFQNFATQLHRTTLGPYLSLPYSYLAMKRPSQYLDRHQHDDQEGVASRIHPSKTEPYLIVYPFTKKREWYLLPKTERQQMMTTHFEIGHRYPSVKINTTYSFGLDDHEFVLAFETESLSDFLTLVMDLRESEASQYTLIDTPIFTCIAKTLRLALDDLGG